MNKVAIIGAGITGLTAAFYLRRKGVPVVIYESSGRVGGVIQSMREDGYLAEFGPNTIVESSPGITELIRDAGLEGQRLDTDPRAEARFVARYRRPVQMPGSPIGFFKTELFSMKAKLALLREPFVPRRSDGKEESIAEFVERRLGKEFLDHAVDALVGGVYAGDPRKLSVSQAFPKLHQLEIQYGSLIKGQILGARERKKRAEVAKDRAPKFSFKEGLQTLPEALILGQDVRLNTTVLKATQNPDGWTLELRNANNVTRAEHSAVLYAGTAFKLAELQLDTEVPIRLESFSEIRYSPVASVVLGFKREDVAHPCQGFGVLVPKIENFKILGTIFSSSLFPNRAPEGHILLTTYAGGERYPEMASLSAQKLVALVCEDLRVLLGVSGTPTFQHTFAYPRAIPQYNIGYEKHRINMNQVEAQAPGFFLAGHYRDGVSLSDSIISGCTAASRVEKYCAMERNNMVLQHQNAN